MARISELREIQREMGEDDTGKNELKQQIEDRSVQYRTLSEKSRELKVLRLQSRHCHAPSWASSTGCF
jgi:hypothetical protein